MKKVQFGLTVTQMTPSTGGGYKDSKGTTVNTKALSKHPFISVLEEDKLFIQDPETKKSMTVQGEEVFDFKSEIQQLIQSFLKKGNR